MSRNGQPGHLSSAASLAGFAFQENGGEEGHKHYLFMRCGGFASGRFWQSEHLMGAASLAGVLWRMTAKKVKKSIWLSDAFRQSRFWVEFRLLEIWFLADIFDSALLSFFGIAVVMMVV